MWPRGVELERMSCGCGDHKRAACGQFVGAPGLDAAGSQPRRVRCCGNRAARCYPANVFNLFQTLLGTRHLHPPQPRRALSPAA